MKNIVSPHNPFHFLLYLLTIDRFFVYCPSVLLLEAGPTFISRNTDNQHSFALISEVADSKPPRLDKLIPAIVLVVAMLAVVTAGVSSLLVCGLITAMIMVRTGILSQQEARDSVSWDVYVTIACAFGIGIALTNSGLAQVIATGLVWVGEALGIGWFCCGFELV